ncbi:MAG: 2,3-bisphosphoglycerate-independent phosphoglycerate mutase, partial [Betaproteobacteria bacterium]|nr:2,3-bisphosphoglycerate-independent phosphoglycerate mutase [Betaproteobacteria bacterium]
FGVAHQHDLPLAPLMLKADGGEPGNHYWLCAEPVQLRVDRNRLIVTARISDYSAGEVDELLTAFNEHFRADGIEVCAPTPLRWYLRAKSVPALVTVPLTQALNRSVRHHLPDDADALAWHRVANEAQMILHTHPVNAAREARGGPVANSLWLWGGGTLPAISARPFANTWGGGHLTRALSAAAGIAHHELATGAEAWLAAKPDGDALIVVDAAANALQHSDITQWRAELTSLDARWIKPLMDAVRGKRIEKLAIVACNTDNLLDVAVSRTGMRRFWRRARPLAGYAAHG